MVYGLLRALPGDHRFVDPVIRATRWRLANLTPASGRQNHTASPSANNALVSRAARVHRIPPRERDDRVSPLLLGRDRQINTADFPSRQEKFLQIGSRVRGAGGLEHLTETAELRLTDRGRVAVADGTTTGRPIILASAHHVRRCGAAS